MYQRRRRVDAVLAVYPFEAEHDQDGITLVRLVALLQTLHCASVPTMSRQQSMSVTLVYIYTVFQKKHVTTFSMIS